MIDKNYVPELLHVTKGLTPSEWEALRASNVSCGGSEAAIPTLKSGKFGRTEFDLYCTKVGAPNGFSPEITTQSRIIFDSGHFLENLVAQLFGFRTGYEVYKLDAMFRHPFHKVMVANPDRFYRHFAQKEPLGVLELKTTSEYNEDWDNDGVPLEYLIQVTFYQSVLNLDNAYIACLKISETLRWVAGIIYSMQSVFGKLPANVLGDIKDQLYSLNDKSVEPFVPMVLSAIDGEFSVPKHMLEDCSDAIGDAFILREIQRDEELEEIIIDRVEKFWNNHIIPKVPPTLSGENAKAAIATLNKWMPSHNINPPVCLSSQTDISKLCSYYSEMEELKKRKQRLSSRVKEIDAEIERLSVPFIEALKLQGVNNGFFVSGDEKYDVSYERTTRTSVPKKNLTLLKAQYPDAYDAVVQEKAGEPSLKIKKKKV